MMKEHWHKGVPKAEAEASDVGRARRMVISILITLVFGFAPS